MKNSIIHKNIFLALRREEKGHLEASFAFVPIMKPGLSRIKVE